MTRSFRAPGDPMSAKPAVFSHKPPTNHPPRNRAIRSALILAAIAKAESRLPPEDQP